MNPDKAEKGVSDENVRLEMIEDFAAQTITIHVVILS